MWVFGACCHKNTVNYSDPGSQNLPKKVHIKLNNDTDILQWFYIRSLTQIDMGKIFKETNLFSHSQVLDKLHEENLCTCIGRMEKNLWTLSISQSDGNSLWKQVPKIGRTCIASDLTFSLCGWWTWLSSLLARISRLLKHFGLCTLVYPVPKPVWDLASVLWPLPPSKAFFILSHSLASESSTSSIHLHCSLF